MRKELRVFILTSFLFGSISCYSQEYTYDSNGNLVQDGNKQISLIHYNHLNLPDTITYMDGRRMVFFYSALGQKLKEQSFDANGTQIQKRDYDGEFFYSNDSLREILHDDGRAVAVNPGNSATSWEYQYHLADHLGNVRVTVTSKKDIDNSKATYESSNAVVEQNKFLRYSNARMINSTLFDHTRNGGTTHYSERLSGSSNEQSGIARSLSVMPGDTIRLEVFAKYVDKNNSNNTAALTQLLAQIVAGTTIAGTVVDGSNYATNGTIPFPYTGLAGERTSTGAGPKAYMNYIMFDRNFVPIVNDVTQTNFVRMTTEGREDGRNLPNGNSHERLYAQVIVKQAGYLYAYLSNEETSPVEVYFDDFTVTQVKGPVIQQTDYDPFGMAFNEYSRENAVPNNELFNGKELQRDFELNWYDYGARMYNAALGRWNVIDPRAEKYTSWSPYNYALNNPIANTDPDGAAVAIHYVDGDQDFSFIFDGGNASRLAAAELNNPFVNAFIEAYDYDVNNGGGIALQRLVKDPDILIKIREGYGDDEFDRKTSTLTWDPTSALATTNGHYFSAATILEHEAYHAVHFSHEAVCTGDLQFGSLSERHNITEDDQLQALANGEIQAGEVARTNHDGLLYQVQGPTTTQQFSPVFSPGELTDFARTDSFSLFKDRLFYVLMFGEHGSRCVPNLFGVKFPE